MAAPDGGGYWILFNNGAVYAYGDTAFFGSLTGANNATAIFCTFDGGGYWIVSSFGAVYAIGDAPYLGGMAGTPLNRAIIAASGS